MYNNFGFTENVFDTEPLNISKHDFQKFIGRVKDIKNFAVDISAKKNATIVVTGHRGVGKTSFVNIIEYAVGFEQKFIKDHIKIQLPHLIPCYNKIQLEPKEDIKNILLKSLSSLLFSIEKYKTDKQSKVKIPTEIKNLTKWISETTLQDTHIGGQLNFGSFLGGGGNFSRTKQHKNIYSIPTNVLQEKLKQVVTLAKKIFKVDGIFLNINNVDILEEKQVCDIFNQLRDYLLNIEGLWIVIIGQPGLYSSLYQQAARVAEVISGQETKLDPLSEEDLMAVLNLRKKIYSQNPKKPSNLPIEESFIRELYKHSDGEIRPVFKVCDEIIRSTFKTNPNMRIIKSSIGKHVLKTVLESQLALDSLKAKDKEIITRILKKGSLRPKDYKELKLKSAVDFTNKARRLIAKNFLKKEVKGNMANYKATGLVYLAKYANMIIEDYN